MRINAQVQSRRPRSPPAAHDTPIADPFRAFCPDDPRTSVPPRVAFARHWHCQFFTVSRTLSNVHVRNDGAFIPTPAFQVAVYATAGDGHEYVSMDTNIYRRLISSRPVVTLATGRLATSICVGNISSYERPRSIILSFVVRRVGYNMACGLIR